MIRSLALTLGNWLAQESGQRDKKNVLVYSLEYVLGSGLKGLALLFAAWLLGIIPETLACVGVFVSLRLFSGGVHNKTYWRCFITSLTSSLGLAWLAKYTPAWIGAFPLTGWFLALLVSLLMFRYAPHKPIMDSGGKGRRYVILRAGSILYPWVLTLLFWVVPWEPSVMQGAVYGMVLQALSVTPGGGKTLLLLDVILDRSKGGESSCSVG